MKLTHDLPIDVRARYKLVRTDDYNDIPGRIIEADEDTGQAKVEIVLAGETKSVEIDWQPGAFRIVSAKRGSD